jgi:hypothetical protein
MSQTPSISELVQRLERMEIQLKTAVGTLKADPCPVSALEQYYIDEATHVMTEFHSKPDQYALWTMIEPNTHQTAVHCELARQWNKVHPEGKVVFLGQRVPEETSSSSYVLTISNESLQSAEVSTLLQSLYNCRDTLFILREWSHPSSAPSVNVFRLAHQIGLSSKQKLKELNNRLLIVTLTNNTRSLDAFHATPIRMNRPPGYIGVEEIYAGQSRVKFVDSVNLIDRQSFNALLVKRVVKLNKCKPKWHLIRCDPPLADMLEGGLYASDTIVCVSRKGWTSINSAKLPHVHTFVLLDHDLPLEEPIIAENIGSVYDLGGLNLVRHMCRVDNGRDHDEALVFTKAEYMNKYIEESKSRVESDLSQYAVREASRYMNEFMENKRVLICASTEPNPHIHLVQRELIHKWNNGNPENGVVVYDYRDTVKRWWTESDGFVCCLLASDLTSDRKYNYVSSLKNTLFIINEWYNPDGSTDDIKEFIRETGLNDLSKQYELNNRILIVPLIQRTGVLCEFISNPTQTELILQTRFPSPFGYIGVKEIFATSCCRVKAVEADSLSNSTWMKSMMFRVLIHDDIVQKPKWHLIRYDPAIYGDGTVTERLLYSQAPSVCDIHVWTSDFRSELTQSPPRKHTFVLLMYDLPLNQLLVRTNIGSVYDVSCVAKHPSLLTRSLIGHMCGVPEDEDDGSIKYVFTDSGSMEGYVNMVDGLGTEEKEEKEESTVSASVPPCPFPHFDPNRDVILEASVHNNVSTDKTLICVSKISIDCIENPDKVCVHTDGTVRVNPNPDSWMLWTKLLSEVDNRRVDIKHENGLLTDLRLDNLRLIQSPRALFPGFNSSRHEIITVSQSWMTRTEMGVPQMMCISKVSSFVINTHKVYFRYALPKDYFCGEDGHPIAYQLLGGVLWHEYSVKYLNGITNDLRLENLCLKPLRG